MQKGDEVLMLRTGDKPLSGMIWDVHPQCEEVQVLFSASQLDVVVIVDKCTLLSESNNALKRFF